MPVSKIHKLVTFDGVQTFQSVDVSADCPDARFAIWSLYGVDNTPVEGAASPVSAGQVEITIVPAPPPGQYHLVGIS